MHRAPRLRSAHRRSVPAFLLFPLALLFSTAAQAALDVAVDATPDPPQPGESMRVEITVTNPGGSTSGAVSLRLAYPQNLATLDDNLVSDGGGCPGISCTFGETVVWNLPALPPGAGTTVTLAPTVAAGTPDGAAIVFDVDALEGGSQAATDVAQVSVLAARVFDLVIDEDRDPVPAGRALVYELTYGNRSAETTTGTTLDFDLPPGVAFTSASDGGVLVGGTVSWSLGSLVGHEGGQRTVRVTAGAGAGEGTLLEADAVIAGQGDFLAYESRTTSTGRVENGSRLIVGMAVGPDPVVPGEPLHATVTVSNPTGGFMNDVLLRLRYPANLGSLDTNLISDGGFCAGITCTNREELFWNLGDLPPGRGITVGLPPVLASPAGGTLVTFPIAVDASGQSRTLARQTVVTRASRPLRLAVDAESGPVGVGEVQTYTLVYGNVSGETTTGTTLRFPLPPGTLFESASRGGVFSGGVVTWNLGTLVGREGGQRQVRVRVADTGGVGEGVQLVVDPATLSGQGNFLPFETRARVRTRVENATRLDVALAFDRDPVVPDERVGVRATVTNRSAVDFANGVVLRLRYPPGLGTLDNNLIVDGFCEGITCTTREVAAFSLGNLPPGGGAVVELPPVVASGTPPGTVITVPAWADAVDRSRSTAAHSVQVREARPLDLSVDVDTDPLGDTAVFSLTLGNRGTAAATGATLTFPVPATTSAVGASNGGGNASGGGLLGNSVLWGLGTLSPGETLRRRVEVAIEPGTPEGQLIRAFDATLRASGPFGPLETRSRDARRVEDVPARLAIASTPAPVSPGSVLDTTLDVTNASPAFLFGTNLLLRYPTLLSTLDDNDIPNGGCEGITCTVGETVFWNLGDLPPGSSVDRTLPPSVSNAAPPGSLVRWWARLTAASFGQAVTTGAAPVGSDFRDAGPIRELAIFEDGFESGNLGAWSTVFP
ncbi:MAG: hypothetical protein AAGD06_24210 [Acidobacteriota bacterium]